MPSETNFVCGKTIPNTNATKKLTSKMISQ